MYHENASTYTELLLRHCCALTVYSYWLVTCEVQIEVWSCYYYKCLTVLLQCPVFTTPLLASIHCKNGELYQMGNLIIYSNIIYSPSFSGQLPGVLTIPCTTELVCMCVLCSMSSQQFQQFKIPNKTLGQLSSL